MLFCHPDETSALIICWLLLGQIGCNISLIRSAISVAASTGVTPLSSAAFRTLCVACQIYKAGGYKLNITIYLLCTSQYMIVPLSKSANCIPVIIAFYEMHGLLEFGNHYIECGKIWKLALV